MWCGSSALSPSCLVLFGGGQARGVVNLDRRLALACTCSVTNVFRFRWFRSRRNTIVPGALLDVAVPAELKTELEMSHLCSMSLW